MSSGEKGTIPIVSSLGPESVVGGLEVEAILRLGREHLFLLFTQKRMLFTHQTKTGAGKVVFSSLLGRMAGGLNRGASKKGTLQRIAAMEPAQILRLNPENFAVEYPRVVSILVESKIQSGRAKITLVTADQKYELYASPVAIEGVREDLQTILGPKAEYK